MSTPAAKQAKVPPTEVTPEQVAQFRRDGYLVIEDFCSAADCQALRARAESLLGAFDREKEPVFTFSTVNQVTTSYFLESGDKVRYFFEGDSVDDKGDLKVRGACGRELATASTPNQPREWDDVCVCVSAGRGGVG